MVTKKSMWIVLSILMLAAWLLGSIPQATAETLNYKLFNHVTKMEMAPIADVEGHSVSLVVREGVIILENGELAWVKAVMMRDFIKGAGPWDMYSTWTFQDGSTIIARTKGKTEATPAGVSSAGQVDR